LGKHEACYHSFGRVARPRISGIAGILIIGVTASIALFGCGPSSSSAPSQTTGAPPPSVQANTTNCATVDEVTACLNQAGYASDAAINVTGDTVSVNPTTGKVDEAYARALAEAVLTKFDKAQTVLVYSAETAQTYTCTRNTAPAAESPSAAADTNTAGKTISSGYYDVAIAGGKNILIGKSKYLALKIYVKNTGTDLMMFDSVLSLEDDAGNTLDSDYAALDNSGLLPPLDTASYQLDDGESTGGWVVFELDPSTKPLYLVIGDPEMAPDIDSMKISLDGLQAVPASSAAAKAYSKAARVGGARVSAMSVTYQEYLRVKNGMTLKKVNAVVGFKGEELSRYSSYTAYSWQNDDGSNMMVSFHGNRAYSKAQAGLK